MAICNHCKHYGNAINDWDEEIDTRWSCYARYQFGKPVIPECLQDYEIRQVVATGKCKYFNKEIDFDSRGLPIIIK